ncbi:hypothetical protein FJTKL_14835 [Diaporthe vaccinii]|uniref:DUF7707 domain-containing protein n=1 Tax=Diaporthe vaccinii TaxID=105482 RepID=A0ABR4F864_9PEZI
MLMLSIHGAYSTELSVASRGVVRLPRAIKAACKSDYLTFPLKTPAPPLFFPLVPLTRYPHFCHLPSSFYCLADRSASIRSTTNPHRPASLSTLTESSASVFAVSNQLDSHHYQQLFKMRSFIIVSALSALLVSAQNSTFSIDPTEVTLSERAQWCSAQSSTCNTLCDSNPQDNSCDVDTLDFSCNCQNGSAPGLQYYTQTMDTVSTH